MTRERRQQQRRQRNIERQQLRRSGRTPMGGVPAENIEFGGFMGWMQRNTKWLFLGGILVMVVSLGGSSLLNIKPTPTPSPTPTPVASATATPSATSTASTTPTPDPSIQRKFDKAPDTVIDPTHTYEAVLHMAKGGDIHVLLDPKNAPIQTNNFVFLARNRFFDGLTFHRVIAGFVAQGGDPQGTGFGGPGYTLPPEKNNLPFAAGVISMASSSAGVSGSQFFITLAPTPSLQGQFSVFGKVTQGMDVVNAITKRDPTQPNQPPADIIAKVEIVEGK